jgi:replicative DNA helicase Mcm
VVAAANPKHGRFDPYEPIPQQFAFSSTLLSRFDLVYTFRDQPDESEDAKKADHVLGSRDAAKGGDATDIEIDPPVDHTLLRKWIALAKQQPAPTFNSPEQKAHIEDKWQSLRSLYDYDPNEPVPVTLRNLEAIVRVAEAAAKFEFAEHITERHVEIATGLVGASMQDIGKDDDGNLDADVHETGESKAQRDAVKAVKQAMQELQSEGDSNSTTADAVVEALPELDADRVRNIIENWRQKGEAYTPEKGEIRYIGD